MFNIINKYNKERRSILRDIGYYFCSVHKPYEAKMVIESLKIKKIKYSFFNIFKKNKTLHIFLFRPGYLIGKGGKTIEGLTNYLNKCHKCNIKILIHDIKDDELLHLFDFTYAIGEDD